MELKKKPDQYATYTATLSYGELLAIRDALTASPGEGPVADEILGAINYYVEKLPQPGEDPEKGDTSNNPSLSKEKADTALDGMELEPPPGEGFEPKDKPARPSSSKDDAEEDTLPEPPAE